MRTIKKLLAAVLVFILAFTLMSGTLASASDTIRVTVNGQLLELDQPPVIVNNRTLVPVRGVFEALDFNVQWNPDARQAVLTRDGYEVIITIGSDYFTTNGERIDLDVPAQIISARTMLPLRAVLESVGYDLEWDGATRTVVITSAATEPVIANTSPFPFEFSTTDLFGNRVTQDSLGEREIFFVYYWTTWCFACVEGLPGLSQLAQEFGDRVGFITLLGDFGTGRQRAIQITQDAGAPFFTVDANHSEFQELMGLLVSGFVPTSVILDANGNVIGEQIVGSGTARFRQAIESALEQNE